MRRIAIVCQRYGEEVNGGAEYYARMLAEHLLPFYNIDVLTTTARDYKTWENYYNPGTCHVNGVSVIRFPVLQQRNLIKFRFLKLLILILPRKIRKKMEHLWLCEQGPYCPELVKHIRSYKEQYDSFVFITYLYYTTVMGIAEVPYKAILVPTAHDEYSIHLDIYKNVFSSIRGIVYLTEEEEQFVEKLFENNKIPHIVAGGGVDVLDVAEKKVGFEYLIYAGRVDMGKGCDIMFRFFERYKKRNPGKLKLVVLGKMMMPKPHTSDIICHGFVSEKEKYEWMSGARALLLPSSFESLSLAVLEALAMGVPVLVNGKCKVLRGHCEKSRAGFAYETYDQFEQGLTEILTDDAAYKQMTKMGKRYIEENYNWNKTIETYKKFLEE